MRNTIDENKSREKSPHELANFKSQPQDTGISFQITLDALPANISIIDADGDIIFANTAWRDFARQNGSSAEAVSEGKNYLDICEKASGEYSSEAKPFANGIRQVLSGKKSSYTKEYPCHSLDHKRWFIGTVAPFPGKDSRAIIVHVNITELKQARRALQLLNKNLEQQVAERTRRIEARTKQLQALSIELIEAEERVRQHFADLLHDDLQQFLVSARMQLQVLDRSIINTPALVRVEQLLEESIKKSRTIVYELSPPVLHHSNLITAIEWLVQRSNAQYGLQITLKIEMSHAIENVFPLKVFIFRAVQELLCNIAKHAGVQIANVALILDNKRVTVVVNDQGRGFDPKMLDSSDTNIGFGLLSIRERANHMGGSLAIDSAPGKGSRFTLTIPLTP